jgi:tRNA dimethylallyltransferase
VTTSRGHRVRVVAIVGPTAVGKSAVALSVAEDLGGEIVSLDSRQMYRGLDIGTAKPSRDDLARVRHHLVDVADPTTALTLDGVQTLAQRAIDDITARGRRPLVVGGTGQYVAAVLEGWQIPRVTPDPALRAELETYAATHGYEALHTRLGEADPVAAARIDARNVRRVVRALEVYTLTGRRISELQARGPGTHDVVRIGLTRARAELYARVDARIDAMIAAGLEAEVRGLVAAGIGFDLPAMSAVGYREWRGLVAGQIDRAEVVRLIRHDTRRLVRSQMTWFRLDDPGIRWFDPGLDDMEDVVAAIRRFVD